ncbi:MAG: Zn-ribbon domain-containing OB-fold protein, partial [Pseudomonadales bacterium]
MSEQAASSYRKPLPEVQPFSEAFWEGTKQHKLLIQHCDDCDSNIFYPRRDCPHCWSQNLGWVEASGKAEL